MNRRMLALVGLCVAVVSCGDGSREVLAHYDSGRLRSEGREIQLGEEWVASGVFRSWHEDGAPAEEGSYSEGEASGAWATWYPDGTLESKGSYLFGEREGVWVFREPDGSLDAERTGIYEAGQRFADFLIDGVLQDDFAEGRPRERVEYVDGLRHGLCESWYPDGAKRSEGRYEGGRKSGRWSYWTRDGRPDPKLSGVYDGWLKVSN